MGQGVRGPPDRPAGQLRPWRGQLMAFAECAHLAGKFGAPPDPLTPPDQRRDAEAGHIGDLMNPPAVPNRDNPTPRAAADVAVGLHRQHEPCRLALHTQHVHPRHVEQHIRASAPRRAAATRTVIHVEVFS